MGWEFENCTQTLFIWPYHIGRRSWATLIFDADNAQDRQCPLQAPVRGIRMFDTVGCWTQWISNLSFLFCNPYIF